MTEAFFQTAQAGGGRRATAESGDGADRREFADAVYGSAAVRARLPEMELAVASGRQPALAAAMELVAISERVASKAAQV